MNFNPILNALNTSKHRVVYNSESCQFENKTTKEAKRLPPHYISDLTSIINKIETEITNNQIEFETEKTLENAFRNKAHQLNKRIVIFNRRKRRAAVEKLEEACEKVRRAWGETHQTVQTAIPYLNSSLQNDGQEEQSNLESPPAQPAQAASTEPESILCPVEASIATAPQSNGQEEQSDLEQPLVEVIPLPPEIPPSPIPPPLPIIAAPPPPCSNPLQPVLNQTFTHKNLTIHADSLPLFPNEPERPQFPEGVDLGKISKINLNERETYVKNIDEYLFGTKKIIFKKVGLNTNPVVIRERNGLIHTLNQIKGQIDKHKQILRECLGIEEKLLQTIIDIESRSKHLDQILDFNHKNEFYPLNLKERRGSGAQIVFVPERKFNEHLSEFQSLTPNDKRVIRKYHAAPSPSVCLENKSIELSETINGLENEKIELETQLEPLKIQKNQIENQVFNGIPFKDWEPLYQQKNNLFASWKSVLDNLQKDLKEESVEAEQSPGNDTGRLNQLKKTYSFIEFYQQTYSTLPQHTKILYEQGLPLPVVDENGNPV